MKRIARLGVLGASVISAGFITVGMGVASAATIANTGPGSFNAILSKSSSFEAVRNVNNVSLNNQNNQTAITGAASVSGNTSNKDGNSIKQRCPQHKTFGVMPSHFVQPNMPSRNNNFSGQGGSATSGDASNFNATTASVNITNDIPVSRHVDGSLSGNNTISTTGPHSVNLISSKTTNNVTVTNTNDVTINNTNNQTAISGNANVSGNTRGGSAVTGDATNVNSTRFDVAIMNQ